MSGFVSAKNFIDILANNDYVYFGQLTADFRSIEKSCEEAAQQHDDCWSATVLDADEFDAWDDYGRQYYQACQTHAELGYTRQSTRVWKSTFIDPPVHFSWQDSIEAQLPLQHAISTPTLQPPGVIMPWHQDQFFYFRRNMPDEPNVIRCLMFITPWKIGHFLQAGDSVITHWRSGDVVIWHPDRWHLATNAGQENKWTCNITGVLQDQVREPLAYNRFIRE